ncbi:MAG: 30S ribosome-binding factor RbfA [Deltaproteobacteria bacterium]|nr:30S ribosome-binding factor RbfA [Deltaproteobacteria bacterium]MBW2382164.1 30S ribosome-binding factor RbfA [Deltaproteobacteria bacterium]
MSMRTDRIAEQIRGEVARVLRDESTDPRIGMLTITRVKLSADLSQAILFWSPLTGADPDAVEEVARGLDSASGFVRRHLAANLNLRRTPALQFKHDPSMAEGSRILSLLRSLPDAEADAGARIDASGRGDAGEEPGEEQREEQNGEEA